MRVFAATYARFVGLAALLYSALVFFGLVSGIHAVAVSDTPWLVAALACIGLTGIAGSVLFLLSFDGPLRFRTRGRRLLGWAGMMICAAMPTSHLFLIAPLVLSGVPTLLIQPDHTMRRRGRHLATSG